MTPTNKLRFVERKVQMHPFYRDIDGGPAHQTYRVLQQWWEYDYIAETDGEWRDVPLEKEEQ